MGIFRIKYQVKPNCLGFLYRENIYETKLEPGYYLIKDWRRRTELFCLPTTSKLINIINQEVLTKDNVAFRFSFNLVYRIFEGEKFLSKFPLNKPVNQVIAEAEQRIYNLAQIIIRNRISEYDSESLNEKRSELADLRTEHMIDQASEFGIEILEAQFKDLTFPKSIQDLFARHLEAKIRAKADLENARTTVATARALKNASEIIKNDENVKFFQLLETINKIASKGKHTFMIGDVNQLSRK